MTSFWDEKAGRKGLQAVLDYEDTSGRKNAYTDLLHRTAIGQAVTFESKQKVLDFGSGIGRLSFWLAGRVASVEGIDASPGMVERARSNAAALGVTNTRFTHVEPPITQLEYEDGAFDRVLCIWVLQHILDDGDLSQVLAELRRVCAGNGVLVFMERTSSQSKEDGMAEDYIERRTLDRYLSLFKSAGFASVTTRTVRSSSQVCGNKYVNRLVVSGLIPRFLYGLLVRFELATQGRRATDWADTLFVCKRD